MFAVRALEPINVHIDTMVEKTRVKHDAAVTGVIIASVCGQPLT
jgi:hypothetical protein